MPGAPYSVTDDIGFDRGTGTGEPTQSVAHNLRFMTGANDGYNARNWPCSSTWEIQHHIPPRLVSHEMDYDQANFRPRHDWWRTDLFPEVEVIPEENSHV